MKFIISNLFHSKGLLAFKINNIYSYIKEKMNILKIKTVFICDLVMEK